MMRFFQSLAASQSKKCAFFVACCVGAVALSAACSGNGGAGGSGASAGANVGGAGSASTASNPSATNGATSPTSTGTGVVITPGDPGAHDVLFTVDSTQGSHPISRYIYGSNQGDFTSEAKGLTLTRVGGNRLTAYNWENNASNAGSDYQYENDADISSSNVAGLPMKQAVQSANDAGASIIMTVPIAGWVSKDESGPCPAHPTQAQIAQRFVPMVAAKGSAFAYPPDTTDNAVYADEFVAYLESQFPSAQTDLTHRIFYMLDNEPDLWSSTHSEIHPDQLTYAEIVQKNTDFATAIKGVAPASTIFGPVNYGWAGYVNLQNAPDANGRDFLEFYLDAMKSAEASAGKRLVDVMDLHWYPEAQGDGHRIVDDGTSAGEVEARVQAPRSLWDASYTETSWIAQTSTNGPINLIPRMKQKISDHYPGTKLSLSEYNYGGSADISGAVAEADVLGIFGREDIFAATSWLLGNDNSYLFAAFAMYRNYDAAGATFGDTSVTTVSSATDKTSAYGSIDSNNPTNLVMVVINKESTPMVAGIALTHSSHVAHGDVYTLTASGATPQKGATIDEVATNAFSYTMPPMSVSTLVFHP